MVASPPFGVLIHRRWAVSAGVFCLLCCSAGIGLGCNIPVFRFALERWQADAMEAIIFHCRDLSPQHRDLVDALRSVGNQPGGHAPMQVVLVDVRRPISAETEAIWKDVQQRAGRDPFLVIRGEHPRGKFRCWASPLTAGAVSGLIDSPVRREISRRILAGDAIVWLVVRGSDPEKNRDVVDLLRRTNAELARTIELPEGIGLPGSELFSEIPLLVQFSVLEADRNDPDEAFLLGLLQGFRPAAFDQEQPLIVPFFGRGRALEIIPADQFNAALVGDLTRFLCGACSCQVKEQNPGFDLFFNVRWNRELFGDAAFRPPAAEGLLQRKSSEPTYVPIPSGRRGDRSK